MDRKHFNHQMTCHIPNSNSFLLTGGRNGKKEFAIKTLDQCFMEPGHQNGMKAYAIRLFKPPEYTCDGPEDA